MNPDIEMHILAIDQNKKEEVVGVGQFHICSDTSLAELALIVSDNYQNKGIGRELLTHMMQLAKYRELKGFEGIVQTGNRPMLRICETISFSTVEKTLRKPGVYELKMYF
nr:GNAT family N-acetyltransferase [Desulfoscipio gibsoniae]